MGERVPPMPPAATTPPVDAERHFRLWLLRATVALLESATRGGANLDELLQRHPALCRCVDEAAGAGLDGMTLTEALRRLDERLLPAAAAPQAPSLPLDRLRHAFDLDAAALTAFLLCGLADEEPRLASLVDALIGHDGRPSRPLLARCFAGEAIEAPLAALVAAGLVGEEVRGRWRLLAVPATVWSALRGLPPPPGEWHCSTAADLPRLDDLILPLALYEALSTPAAALHESACWVLRGAPGSGRRALAGAIARSRGQGLIEPASNSHEPGGIGAIGGVGALATLLGAMPLLTLEPAPGERLVLPVLPGYRGAIAVRLPRHGGLAVERRTCRWLELAMPPPEERRRHWVHALGGGAVSDALVGLRLPRGTIHRVAHAVPPACVDAAAVVIAEVEERGRFALDGVAHRVAPLARAETFLLVDDAREEFAALVARCRHREALGAALPAAFGHASAAGVRALFKGPSGTGKTLAARHLAAEIGRPLYRVDLAAIVSKYIGETERNLERVFEAAESLDILLLIDEGDALMAGRTGVSNATDRYANLETNYLLQRLESYAGILVVTTNAPERIDAAFARRMDVTLEFPLPDADTRFDLWLAHLAAGNEVSDERLDEVASRCALSGGQIRNAALHATLLALQHEAALGDSELLAALQREYRKAGLSCPSLAPT